MGTISMTGLMGNILTEKLKEDIHPLKHHDDLSLLVNTLKPAIKITDKRFVGNASYVIIQRSDV